MLRNRASSALPKVSSPPLGIAAAKSGSGSSAGGGSAASPELEEEEEVEAEAEEDNAEPDGFPDDAEDLYSQTLSFEDMLEQFKKEDAAMAALAAGN